MYKLIKLFKITSFNSSLLKCWQNNLALLLGNVGIPVLFYCNRNMLYEDFIYRRLLIILIAPLKDVWTSDFLFLLQRNVLINLLGIYVFEVGFSFEWKWNVLKYLANFVTSLWPNFPHTFLSSAFCIQSADTEIIELAGMFRGNGLVKLNIY